MTDSAAIERATDALTERYVGWTWSRDRWREIATLVLDAAAPPPRHQVRRLHWPHPRYEDSAACNCYGDAALTDDPALVTCGHCKKFLRDIAA